MNCIDVDYSEQWEKYLDDAYPYCRGTWIRFYGYGRYIRVCI